MMAKDFNIPSEDLKMVLPTSLYMCGFVIGPLIFGPLSESLGRKPVLIATLAMYLIFTMACALAPNFAALVVFRFLCGFGGSAPNAVLGGLFSDIYTDPHSRGLVMSWFMFATTFPPLLGPIISGFVSSTSWRWAFWAGLIIGGPAFPLICTIPETFYPVLLRRYEQGSGLKRMQSMNSVSVQRKMRRFFKKARLVLSRPFVMIIREPIVAACSLYLALIYSMLYLFFQAYPIVFQGKNLLHV